MIKRIPAILLVTVLLFGVLSFTGCGKNENEENGLFMPQNAEYSNTSELVKIIGEANGRKVRLVRGVAWLIKLSGHFVGLVNKAFGNLSYDFSASEYKYNYQIISLRDSIIETEKKDG